MVGEDGVEVPFEHLDGCCQKEVISRRRNKEVNEKLREGDRSLERMDIKEQTFRRAWVDSKCLCCKESEDYHLLSQLRLKMESENAATSTETEDVDTVDSDSDTGCDDLDSKFASVFEIERKAKFESMLQSIEKAKSFGFGMHVEDSVGHVSQDISFGLPLVLHCFDPNDPLSAKLDLLLEKLSLKYLGTRFRRTLISSHLVEIESLLSFGVRRAILTNAASCLLCFHSRHLAAAAPSLLQFGDTKELFSEDVESFLDGTRVLKMELELDLMSSGSSTAAVADVVIASGAQGDEDQPDEYCDDPNCTRRYPHEHIGKPKADGTMKMPSFMDSA
mmetsp:Transcript_17442/g.29434  ORF Transcript_17442/g.29434 Transcript_17442/m.29434 type:complete len:333 (+) Transcript_17442:66-1064(+)